MNLSRFDQYLIIILVFILVFCIGAVVAKLNDIGIIMMITSAIGFTIIIILFVFNMDKVLGDNK